MKDSDVAIARAKLVELAEQTGLTFNDLVDLWTTETAEQLESATKALLAGDLPEATRLVHGAAGATGLCGVTELADQLKAVELLTAAGRSADAQNALVRARARFEHVSGVLGESRRSRVAGRGSRVAGRGSRVELRTANCELRSTVHDPRSTVHGPRPTVYGPRSTTHALCQRAHSHRAYPLRRPFPPDAQVLQNQLNSLIYTTLGRE